MAAYAKTKGANLTVANIKTSFVVVFLGAVMTSILQDFLVEQNVSGIAGTLLGYAPMFVSLVAIAHIIDVV